MEKYNEVIAVMAAVAVVVVPGNRRGHREMDVGAIIAMKENHHEKIQRVTYIYLKDREEDAPLLHNKIHHGKIHHNKIHHGIGIILHRNHHLLHHPMKYCTSNHPIGHHGNRLKVVRLLLLLSIKLVKEKN